MGAPGGFEFQQRGAEVRVRHHGRLATTLRGRAALDFLAEIDAGADPQLLMARVTGSYKHGNERTARQHPRNRGR
jgi:hypothetical protein